MAPMRVAGQVLQHVLWPAEWLLRVDHPVGVVQRADERAEQSRIRKPFEVAMEGQLSGTKCSSQTGDELASKDFPQYLDWQKESPARMSPARPIESQASRRNDVMNMRVMLQVLAPGMQNTEKADVGA